MNFLKLIVQFIIWFFQVPLRKPTGSIVYPSVQPVNTPTEDLQSEHIVEETTEIENVEEAIENLEDHAENLTIENLLYFEERFLPSNQYINEYSDKIGIVLHHTVSRSDSVDGDIKWWNSNKERVGTHFIVDKFGNIYQCVPLDKWVHHLWVNALTNKIALKFKSISLNNIYNSQTIGIELDSAGGLLPRNGYWHSAFNKQMKNSDVYQIDYRGYKAFEKYYPEQIESVKNLILYLIEKYPLIGQNIKDDYSDIFNINLDALNHVPGIYTHTSYRTDKSDCAPQRGLVEMLNSLKNELRSTSIQARQNN